MTTTIRYVFNAETKPITLKCGVAEYWILYISEGMLDILVNEERHKACEGQVVIIEINPNDVKLVPNSCGEAFLLELDKDEVFNSVRWQIAVINKEHKPVKVVTTGKQKVHIDSLFQQMATQEKEPFSLLPELLVRLHRANMKAQTSTFQNSAACIKRVCTYLKKEYARPLTVDGIATHYNISASYLSHVFKTAIGVSIMQYVLQCRIDAARHYLQHTEIPIKEVAEKCGFNNISNFGRTFKKETGFTPRRYRSNHKQDSKEL